MDSELRQELANINAKLAIVTALLDNQTKEYISNEEAQKLLEVALSADRVLLAVRLIIPTCDGDVSRDAIGTEELKEINKKTGEIGERAYGDPSSNAESMAFRRAAARFGLGLYLYDK